MPWNSLAVPLKLPLWSAMEHEKCILCHYCSESEEWVISYEEPQLHCIDSISNAWNPFWPPEDLFKWMVGAQGKEEQDGNQILPRSASLLQAHATFADSCGRWDSGELNGVTAGVWDLWK